MTATYEDLFAEIDWLLLVDTLSVIDEKPRAALLLKTARSKRSN
jgi:hypothetical protein